MQRRTWILVVMAVTGLALVGLIAAMLSQKPKHEAATGPGEPAKTVAGEPARAGAEPEFSFRRLEVDTAKANGEACLVFTQNLDDTGRTRYSDYVTLDPAVPVDMRAQGNRLCLAGLTFGKDYTATLRAGLPGAKDTKLEAAETVPVSLRDRPPFVGFGEGFILPRNSTDGIPVTTVNVSKIELQVVRVNDRLLSQLRSDLVNDRMIYGYDRQQMVNEQGREIWHGTMDVKSTPNESVVTLFPLRDALKAREPGVYLVTARDAAKKQQVSAEEDDEDWQGRPSQWVIDTDIGITTYNGADGLHVYARSLATAEPLAGVELALVARDNGELARISTGSGGAAQFAPGLMRGVGGAEPVLVMAYGKGNDFAYSDLRRPAFDLSDRGVSGRDAPGPVDAYMFTERGIYRAGETVQLVTLLRDREARALSDMPVSLVVRRPDGLEYRKIQLGPLKAGGAGTAITLTPTAPRGHWSISAYLGTDDKALGRVTFDVQDFVPERLKLTLDAPKDALRPGDDLKIGVDARFLYGAPASNLSGEADLRIVTASNPFPAFKDYHFGLVEESFSAATSQLNLGKTDEKGHGEVTGTLDAGLTASAPLEADVTVALDEPGGRTSREQAGVPVLTHDMYVGLKPLFNDDSVSENTDAHFEIIAVDRTGKQIAAEGLRYELVREDTDYQWYQADGQWRYDTVTRDKLIETGTVNAKADGAAPFTARVAWGTYRLTLRNTAKSVASSYRFYAGWGAGGTESRPDRIIVASKSPSFPVGGKATITLRPPIPGKALVVIASDKVLESKLVDVPQGGTEISFDVTNEWGSGVYALVTLYRPLEGKEAGPRVPARAIGLTWLGVDMKDRQLALNIGSPDVVRPRTNINVPIEVTNTRLGEAVYVTLAAVDEGILQLTDYASPAPSAYYFGKRKLGLEIRDDYGRLITPSDAALGAIRSGGDGLGGRGLSAVPTRTVALFSGLIAPDDRGKAVIPLAIPDFVGELRLMATAFGPARLGEAAKAMTVRDPVVADLTLPRFLAPGDDATATLLLDNVEGAEGDYKATVTATQPLTRADSSPVTIALKQHERKTLGVPLKAAGIGVSTVSLTLEGPGGFSIARSWPIEVRPAALPDFKAVTASLDPGATAPVPATLLQGFLPQSAKVSVTVADRKGIDVPGLLRWLDRYPFGCIEQTTSRAMPLLYVNKLAAASDEPTDKPVEARVQDAIERVVDMQMIDGSFGMWGPRGDAADPWIGVFAADFLTDAKAKNYVVPDTALKQADQWLRRMAGTESQPDGVRAYALYVLARSAAVPVGDVRYFFDTEHDKFKTAIAPAFAAAALAEMGDRARAADGFAAAREMALKAEPADYAALDYGSLLRDLAAITTLAASSGDAADLPALMTRMAALEPPIDLTTTQEKAWLIRAAAALDAASSGIDVAVTGANPTVSKGLITFSPTTGALAAGVSLTNKGTTPVWWTATASGIPDKPPAAMSAGITAQKHYFTLDGGPVDLAHVKQSQRFVVEIEGNAAQNVFRNTAVLDLLPAGFEIEAVIEPTANGDSPYPFLNKLSSLSMSESRDDRFVAAFTLGDRYPDKKRLAIKPDYAVAYVVRAVTPGHYVLPGAEAEDMYRPDVRARTAPGALTVIPAE